MPYTGIYTILLVIFRRLTICLLQSQKLKGTRQAKGNIAGARSSYTKKFSQASQRVKRANLALKARRGKR